MPDTRSNSRTLNGWRTDPYRFLFPMGYVLLVAGLGIWSVDLLGGAAQPAKAHALLLGNGFLYAFALGLLLAEVPRTVDAPPAGAPLLAGLALCLAGTGVSALSGRYAAAYLFHAASAAGLLAFLLPRIRDRDGESRPGPVLACGAAAFALAWGVLGALSVTGTLPPAAALRAPQAGLQGFALFFCMACLRWDARPGARPASAGLAPAAIVLILSLALEWASSMLPHPEACLRAAFAIRLAWALFFLRIPGDARPLPTGLPGFAPFLRAGAGAVAAGMAIAAAAPRTALAAAHLAYLGGFAWIALAAATGVITERLDPRRKRGGLRLLAVAGVSLAAAAALRAWGLEREAGRAVLLPLAASLALLPALIWAVVMFARLAEGKSS